MNYVHVIYAKCIRLLALFCIKIVVEIIQMSHFKILPSVIKKYRLQQRLYGQSYKEPVEIRRKLFLSCLHPPETHSVTL
jgi:hypothetical protein